MFPHWLLQTFCWHYTSKPGGESLQKLRRLSLWHLCSHIHLCRGSPEFSACLKAASVLEFSQRHLFLLSIKPWNMEIHAPHFVKNLEADVFFQTSMSHTHYNTWWKVKTHTNILWVRRVRQTNFLSMKYKLWVRWEANTYKEFHRNKDELLLFGMFWCIVRVYTPRQGQVLLVWCL